jgi:hypothetical protein
VKLAILDDYQRVALALRPSDDLGEAASVTAFHDHLSDDALIERLASFEC